MGRAKKQIHGAIYTDDKGYPAKLGGAKSAGADPGRTKQAANSLARHTREGRIQTKEK